MNNINMQQHLTASSPNSCYLYTVTTAGVEEQTKKDTNHATSKVHSLQGNFLDGSLGLFLATSSHSAPQQL